VADGHANLFRRDRVFDFMVPKVVEGLDLSHGTVLYMEDVSVSFDGFKAINNLNFYVNAGELRCLIGPNGAGKTTMMDIVTGKTRPDTGTCWFGARMNLLQMSEPEIAQAGIGRKFQKPTVFEHHSVFENLEFRWRAQGCLAHAAGEASVRPSVSASTRCSNLIGLADEASAMRAPCRTGRSSGSRSACC
jgi:ABC-type uncharacterized transport system ATPase subunit